MYSKLFDWIVHRCNYAMDPNTTRLSYARECDESNSIGVLDIYGFGKKNKTLAFCFIIIVKTPV